MGTQDQKIRKKASIIACDVSAQSLAHYCPDLETWPNSWEIARGDVAIGQRIVAALTPFLLDLLHHGLTDKTLARHRDHLWMLGGEVIGRRHDDADLCKRPVEDVLFDLIEEEGGPLIWPNITESKQKAFDATCRKLYRFHTQGKPETGQNYP
jgi:hypothetical protein